MGTNSTSNVNSPQLVIGPWETTNTAHGGASVNNVGAGVIEALSVIQSKRFVVRNIFCGGDQSFALISPYAVCYDNRIFRLHFIIKFEFELGKL